MVQHAQPGVSLARTPSTEVDPDGANFLESFLELPTSQELIRFLFIGHVKNLEYTICYFLKLLNKYNLQLALLYMVTWLAIYCQAFT